MPRINKETKLTNKRRKDEEETGFDLVRSDVEDFTTAVSDEEVEKAQDRLREAKKYLATLTRDAKKAKKTENEFESEHSGN